MGCDHRCIYRCHRSCARKTPTIVMTPEDMHTTGCLVREVVREPQEEGSYDGGGLSNFIRLHGACAGGCGTTSAQNKCLKKAGSNKSQGAKCFGAKGNFREFVEVVNEGIGLVQCVAEDGNCPDFGAPPHA
jgi:hypothetical protein